MQEAVAIGLTLAPKHDFFPSQLKAYTERRDILCSYFDQLGLSYTKPEGSYFVLVDMSPITVPAKFLDETPDSIKVGRGKDFTLCWWLAQEIRVVGIPPSEVSFVAWPSIYLTGDSSESMANMISSIARSMKTSESALPGFHSLVI